MVFAPAVVLAANNTSVVTKYSEMEVINARMKDGKDKVLESNTLGPFNVVTTWIPA